MIELLFKSKIRKKVLRLLYLNQDKEYYVNEIARLLNVSVGSLHKELMKLLKNGVLQVKEIGNLKLYSLNKNYHFFQELKEILKKSVGIEEQLKVDLNRLEGVKCAFIYGSWASNQVDEHSDIDLFIIGTPDQDKLLEVVSKIEDEIQREISYTIFPEEEFKRKVKEGTPFIESLLTNPKVFLKKDEEYLSKIVK